MGQHLLIRADANTRIGTGHVMRCLALAQAWQDQGGCAVFVCSDDLPASLQQRLDTENMSVHLHSSTPGSREDAQNLIGVAYNLNVAAVVLDGYHFRGDYQRWTKEAELRLLVLDGNGHSEHYFADVVLNQNIHASEKLYTNREPYTRLLLGTRYALLRREFLQWQGWQKCIQPQAHNLLVTMGGSDPNNVTPKVLGLLEQVDYPLHVSVVIGGSNPYRRQISTQIADSKHEIRLLYDVGDMPSLMAECDMAISAGGSTVWEMAFMGVPMILIVTADNQQQSVDELHRLAVVGKIDHDADSNVSLDQIIATLRSYPIRHTMSQKERQLVDGHGCERVIATLTELRA